MVPKRTLGYEEWSEGYVAPYLKTGDDVLTGALYPEDLRDFLSPIPWALRRALEKLRG